jgi:hypothetical protein
LPRGLSVEAGKLLAAVDERILGGQALPVEREARFGPMRGQVAKAEVRADLADGPRAARRGDDNRFLHLLGIGCGLVEIDREQERESAHE